jgi:DNA-binding beta-propeller fold protein YncE
MPRSSNQLSMASAGIFALLVAVLVLPNVPLAGIGPGPAAARPASHVVGGAPTLGEEPLGPRLAHAAVPARATGVSKSVERPTIQVGPSYIPAAATVSLINNTVAYGNEPVRAANGLNGIAFNPTLGTIFAIGSSSNGLVELNLSTNALVAQTPTNDTAVLGNAPYAVAYDSADSQLFVSDPSSNEVMIYNVSASGAMARYAVLTDPAGYSPEALLAIPSLHLVIIANKGNDSVTVLDASHDKILVAYDPVGAGPGALGYDPVDNLVYIADEISPAEVVSMTASGSFAVAGNGIALPAASVALAYDPTSGMMWSGGSTVITEISPSAYKAVANVSVPSRALHDVEWDSNAMLMVASNFISGNVSRLDPSASGFGNVTASSPTGGDPLDLVVNPDLYQVDVADAASNEIVGISDANAAVVSRWTVGLAPGLGTFDPVNERLVIPDSSADYVLEVDDKAVTPGNRPLARSLFVPGHPVAAAFDQLAGTIVAGLVDGDVVALNASSGALVRSYNVTTTGIIADLTYADGELLVTGGTDSVWVLDARTLLVTSIVVFAVGAEPRRMAYEPAGQLLFVSLFGANAVGVVNLQQNRIVATYSAGKAPLGVDLDPQNGEIFVADTGTNETEALLASNGSFVGREVLPAPPAELLYLAGANVVLVTVPLAGELFELDPSTLLPSNVIRLGDDPDALVYDNATANLYIANVDDGSLSIVPSGAATIVPFSVHLTASTNATDVGGTVTFSVTTPYPAWDFSYIWLQTPTGCASRNLSTLTCRPSVAATGVGTSVRVSNLAGDFLDATPVNITIVEDPTGVILTESVATLTAETPVTFTTTWTGGIGPFTFVYSGLPPGCPPVDLAVFTCKPTGTGGSTPAVVVTDSIGFSASAAPIVITVNHPPLTTPSLSSGSITIGQSVTISANASQGTSPYSYAYAGLPAGCKSTSAPTLTCTPSATGNFTITVQVVDSSGASVTSRPLYLAVNPTAPPGGTTGSGSSANTILYIGLGIVVIAAVVAAVVLLARRRGAGAPQEAASPEPEELPGAGEFSMGSALPQEESAAGEAGDTESTTPAPRYFSGQGAASTAARPAAPPRGGSPAKLVCPSCGAENDPWLVNCRNCRRPLSVT